MCICMSSPSMMQLMNMAGVVASPNCATLAPLLVIPAAIEEASSGPDSRESWPICSIQIRLSPLVAVFTRHTQAGEHAPEHAAAQAFCIICPQAVFSPLNSPFRHLDDLLVDNSYGNLQTLCIPGRQKAGRDEHCAAHRDAQLA